MFSYPDQGNIIENLNKYLQWHNLSLRMNEAVICNGLSAVYMKYALENRQDDFLEMLQYIAGKEPSSEIESQINHFVVEILISYRARASKFFSTITIQLRHSERSDGSPASSLRFFTAFRMT